MTVGLLTPELLDALLKHPSMLQNQQVYTTLLTTSQALCEAVTTRCSGQLTVQLTAAGMQKQKVRQFAAWLTKHAPLVRQLEVQLSDFERFEYEDGGDHEREEKLWSRELKAVITALGQAGCPGCRDRLFLQHISLTGKTVPLEFLEVLPPNSLTSLQCEPPAGYMGLGRDIRAGGWYDSMDAISQLSQLRELDIRSSGLYDITKYAGDALVALTSLQHLTKLQLGDASAYQLQHLPPNLKELQVAVRLVSDREAGALAQWLQKHATSLTDFDIAPDPIVPVDGHLEFSNTTQNELVTALQGAAAASPDGHFQLQRLAVRDLKLSTAFYQQIASRCQLVSLAYPTYNASIEALGVVFSMTTLQELTFLSAPSGEGFNGLDDNVLQQLSAITGLTRLCFGGEHQVQVAQCQVEHLPDGIRELVVDNVDDDDGLDGQPILPWALGHLSSVTHLEIPYLIKRSDVLPPDLVALKLRMRHTSLHPLLKLQNLQALELWEYLGDRMPVDQLLTLTCLSSLTNLNIGLEFHNRKQPTMQHVAAWAALPLRALSINFGGSNKVPDYVIMGLTSLHGLTKLDLSFEYSGYNKVGPALLQALPLCTQLQVLKLYGCMELGSSALGVGMGGDVEVASIGNGKGSFDGSIGNVEVDGVVHGGVDGDVVGKIDGDMEVDNGTTSGGDSDVEGGGNSNGEIDTADVTDSDGDTSDEFDEGYHALMRVVSALPSMRECVLDIICE